MLRGKYTKEVVARKKLEPLLSRAREKTRQSFNEILDSRKFPNNFLLSIKLYDVKRGNVETFFTHYVCSTKITIIEFSIEKKIRRDANEARVISKNLEILNCSPTRMLRKLRDATIILQALRLMFKVYLPGLSTSTSNTEQVAPTYLQSSRAIGSRQYYQHPPPRMSIYLCEANEITFLFTPCFEKRSEKNLRSSRKKDTLPDNFVTRINSSLSIVTDLREKENKRMKGRKIKITESPKI